MALSSNLISFIFFTALLLPLHQINARESQFFSKVTNVNNKETTVIPNKEEPVNKPEQQQQPAFIPETENSYGLYGHDESNIPSTKTTPTTNYQSYKTTTEFEDTSKYNNNNNKYYNYDNNDNAYYNTNNQNEFSNTRIAGTGYYSNNNNNYNYNNNYNDDAFGNGYQNELSDTKSTEGSGYNSVEKQNNYNNERYTYTNNNNNYNNNAANENYFYSTNNNNNNAANNRYNGERQGMSDTRFMEGGKYFFDTNPRYNTPLHGDAYRGLKNENWYNNNNNNYNEYQNQENFEDEP